MDIKKLCILGLGYIGLPTASTFATHGLQVAGVDTNARVVESLRREEIHIYEPGLRTMVQAAIRSGNLVVQSKPECADAFIIAVPGSGNANLHGDRVNVLPFPPVVHSIHMGKYLDG